MTEKIKVHIEREAGEGESVFSTAVLDVFKK
jgi:hypothetical protein